MLKRDWCVFQTGRHRRYVEAVPGGRAAAGSARQQPDVHRGPPHTHRPPAPEGIRGRLGYWGPGHTMM